METQDKVDMSRLAAKLAPHELNDPAKLRAAGFVLKEDKILCASPKATQSFWAPGACDVAFHAQLDRRDRVTTRVWTPITAAEHRSLQGRTDPHTGHPHLLFAHLPLRGFAARPFDELETRRGAASGFATKPSDEPEAPREEVEEEKNKQSTDKPPTPKSASPAQSAPKAKEKKK